MTGTTVWLQISAGQGPSECAWVVAKLAEVLRQDAEAQGVPLTVLELVPGDRPGTCRSVLVEAEGPSAAAWAAGWEGTAQWVGPSPFRPHHKRRNWFVGVARFAPPDGLAWSLEDLRFETARASGPGGQHVNKTESAVRVIHVPTGLTAVAQDGRSQHQNRKLALARLAQLLADQRASGEARARSDRWGQHQALERGNATRVFEGAGFRSKIP